MTTKLLIAGALLAGLITFAFAQNESGTPGYTSPNAAPTTPGARDTETPGTYGREREGVRDREGLHEPGMHTGKLTVGKEFDKEYVTSAIKCDIFAMKIGQKVAEKATNPDIKQYAQKLHDSHKQNLEQLKQLANSKNWEAPEKAENWQQEYITHLGRLDTAQLERHFLFAQVGFHQQEVLANKFAAQKAQDPEIRSLAMRSVPKMQNHLQMASRLTEQLTGIEPEFGVTGR